MDNKFNKDGTVSYYNMVKGEFLPLIPEGSNVVLDMGCGSGQFGRVLKDLNKASELVGVEIHPRAAEEASKYYNKVYKNNIETLELPYDKYFDFVICGDILEHLVDPWATLDKINKMLKQGGSLICSIPNIRYWKIITSLALKGKWAYADAGILDSTHLRFFTKSSLIEMLHSAGYQVDWIRMSIHGRKKFANRVSLGLFSEFLATQIMIAARKD